MNQNRSTNDLVRSRAESWLSSSYDPKTRAAVQSLLDEDSDELTDAFYKTLAFGTGGLRGIIGVGSNRINRYTIGSATQGLSNYLKKQFPNLEQISVAIAYDSRIKSPEFAQISAEVLSANGIKAFIFEEIRPTPELSFTVRELGCQAGIVITASHNPKEYNGYKVYWSDGGQLVPPHDQLIVEEINSIDSVSQIKFCPEPSLIQKIDSEIDDKYSAKVKSLSLNPEIIKQQKDFKIVYTAIHGTGRTLVPRCLKEFGFENVLVVPEQNIADGNFPTVSSPNPEDPQALKMALDLANLEQADLVLATDPDSDRVGIAARGEDGELELLNGNQIASILIYYLLDNLDPSQRENKFVAKTIVTTELIRELASFYQVECLEVLTGFKFIAEQIKLLEGKKQFLGGGEESFGYLVGDFVRDKDAIISCCMIAEITAWAKSKGKTLTGLLKEIYLSHSFYLERLVSITKLGKSGEEEISTIIKKLRDQPPQKIAGSAVCRFADYQNRIVTEIGSGKTSSTGLPRSNILQFFTEAGDKITVRPSGTEPKIKLYFAVKGKLRDINDYSSLKSKLEQRLDLIESQIANC